MMELIKTPQALDIEEAVLGATLLNADEAGSIIQELPPEVFYKQSHRLIWMAIRELQAEAQAIDILTVVQRLRKNGVLAEAGGAVAVSKLTSRVSGMSGLHSHQLILRQVFIARRHREICQEMILNGIDETSDPLTILDKNRKALEDLHLLTVFHKSPGIAEVAEQSIKDAKHRAERMEAGHVGGVPSGLIHLDQLTGGWQKGDLIILGARPSMGKTSKAMGFALAGARQDKRVRIFSLEVRGQNLVDKMIMAHLDIDANDYRLGQITHDQWEHIEQAKNLVSALPIRIDDQSSSTFAHMRSVVRGDVRAGEAPDLIIIDYLQLASPGSSNRNYNRENEVSQMSRSAKALAKDFDVPVILLSQMSREVEKRKGHRPQLADLRESGAIEQDADIVMFLWRPCVYGIEADANGETTAGLGELVIEKHRNGPLGVVPFKHSNDMTQFWSVDHNSTAKEMRIAQPTVF